MGNSLLSNIRSRAWDGLTGPCFNRNCWWSVYRGDLETAWSGLCQWHTMASASAAAGFLDLRRPRVHHRRPSSTLRGAGGPLISIPAQLPSFLAFISGSQESHDAYRSPGFLFELGRPQHFPARRPLIWFPPSPEGRSHRPAAPGTLCQPHLPPWHLGFQHRRPRGALARALPASRRPRGTGKLLLANPEFPHNLC